ncbi:Cx9C motif-containing protein 4 [Trichoplax sp. H2]|nr:Cx9C motif-containing protein 4 [Trichoplax sp. H2]|eukprot:RDD38490.1 Cx9C motif-containing protein 4 [Trichoplax sp. H2]
MSRVYQNHSDLLKLIYTKEMNPKKEPCKDIACAIQVCLRDNHYQEDKCKDILEAMRRCCLKPNAKNSICCSGFKSKE